MWCKQIICLLLLCTVVQGTPEFYIVTVNKALWDQPQKIQESLKALERESKVKFWASLGHYKFVVSLDKHTRGRTLSSSDIFSVQSKEKNELQQGSSVRYSILTCVDNLDLRSMFTFSTESLFDVEYDHVGHGTNNLALVHFTSIEAATMCLDILHNSDSVIHIEPIQTQQTHNQHALKTSLYGSDVEIADFRHLQEFGEGSIVTIGDTGMDTNHCFFSHPDFEIPKHVLTRANAKEVISRIKYNTTPHPKVLAYLAISFKEGKDHYETDFSDETDGHGTHVAGSSATGSVHPDCPCLPTDVRSKAKLLFIDLKKSDSSDEGLVVPQSLQWIMKTSYDLGSRIFTNSWGSNGTGYSLHAYQIDYFIHFNSDYTVLVSAGNSGPEGGTIGSPATSKNAIAVGSTLNTHLSFIEYSTLPMDAFLMDANDITQFAQFYNQDQLSAFSSRGPTYDGRIKPDICTPGETVYSARSLPQGQSPNNEMSLKRGTSMACPLTASMVSVIEERLKKTYHVSHPLNSLKKAILFTSTKQLNGGSRSLQRNKITGTITVSHNASTLGLTPFDQGFGRVHLYEFLNGRIAFKDRLEFYSFSQPKTLCFQSERNSLDSIITLVWDDVPTMGYLSKRTLVNNLDMRVVVSPLGKKRYVFNGNNKKITDNLNNVEQVRFQTTVGDQIRITLSPNGPITSIRPDKVQRQFASLAWSSHLLEVPCISECTPEDLPFECIYQTTGGPLIGAMPCRSNRYDLTCQHPEFLTLACETDPLKTIACTNFTYDPLDVSQCANPCSVPSTESAQRRALSVAEIAVAAANNQHKHSKKVSLWVFVWTVTLFIVMICMLSFYISYSLEKRNLA